jgi:hypothetical protein
MRARQFFKLQVQFRSVHFGLKMESSNQSTPSSFTFAAIQMTVGLDKSLNIQSARDSVREASSKGANVICLPV